MTPAGTSNELDVQNEWEEKNTHTHLYTESRLNYYLSLSKTALSLHSKFQICRPFAIIGVFRTAIVEASFEKASKTVICSKNLGIFGTHLYANKTNENAFGALFRMPQNSRCRAFPQSFRKTYYHEYLLLFVTFSVLVANPKKNYFTRWPIPLMVC